MRALDNPFIRDCDGYYVASNPQFGALSSLTKGEIFAFHLFCMDPDDTIALVRYFVDCEFSEELALASAEQLIARWVADGWCRDAFPSSESLPLAAVYFTVTRFCDLACPYCYQGLSNRKNTDMTIEQARITLDKIAAFNPQCNIIVTGGEPFIHPQILDILDLIEERCLPFSILTNGTQIKPDIISRLKKYEHFKFIQISLDGFSEDTFALTRGRSAFPKVMNAVEKISQSGLPFVLAPTLHEGNAHELYEISAYAVRNNGWISPNGLSHVPLDSNKRYLDADDNIIPLRMIDRDDPDTYDKVVHKLALSNETLVRVIDESSKRINEEFGIERVAELVSRFAGGSVCSVDQPNSHFICGMGHSLLDIDWNGDVYPCHMLKAEELILGNIYECGFDDVFTEVALRGMRVESFEIEKCSGCDFNSTCGSGCRAGSYFKHGRFDKESVRCDVNSSDQERRLYNEALSRDPLLSSRADSLDAQNASIKSGNIRSQKGSEIQFVKV